MKQFLQLERDILSSKELKKLGMDIAQHIFTKSQDNLVNPMPWGDEKYPNDKGKMDTAISDTGAAGLLGSGIPPHFINGNTIVFGYDAPHAEWVEYGTPPHPVGASKLVGWVHRKLEIKNDKKALRIAYAIATKIKKEGVLPHPFMRPSLNSAIKKFGLSKR